MQRSGATLSNNAANIRFEFGENWRNYSKSIGNDQINESKNALKRLLGVGNLDQKTFLDIGCGSGLHALAALQLGAKRVVGFDFDERAVETSIKVISQFWEGSNWAVERADIFELSTQEIGKFDIVYSWGVLHHTGDMWAAVAKSAEFVRYGGVYAIALYRKTALCGIWRRIKKTYSSSSRPRQKIMQGLYVSLFFVGLVIKLRNPIKYIRHYHHTRGMSFLHDVHDWLGGFPYESAHENNVIHFVESRGFRLERKYCATSKSFGIFGSGCDEFLFIKKET